MRARFSDRVAGSFAPDDVDETSRQSLVPLPWSWLRQVHGARTHLVTAPGSGAGLEGDALVTSVAGCALSVQVADCVPVLLVGEAAFAVAHAGWRGLQAGVLDSSLAQLERQAHGDVSALVGPHIGPECYEFADSDLEVLVSRFGSDAAATTSWGTPALDLGAVVRSELLRLGVHDIVEVAECTACHAERYFSHRARAETGRHSLVAWLESA